MKINWRVRIKNKNFWVAIIPAVLLLADQIMAVFGVELDAGGVTEQAQNIVSTVFMILSILGIVEDFTTAGIGDSARALEYDAPKDDRKKEE